MKFNDFYEKILIKGLNVYLFMTTKTLHREI